MRDLLLKFIRNLIKRSSKPVMLDGLWVGAGEGPAPAKVRDALALIRTYDPRRYSRLSKDLKGILVEVLPGPIGQFNPSEDFCDLDERFVTKATPREIASVIVHEATHARLWHRGIRYDEAVRARVEHVCIRQEKCFASKLPEAASVIFEHDRRLGAIDADFCSNEAWSRRHVRGATAALRHLGIPRWLIVVVLKTRRAKMRRWRRRRLVRGAKVSA